MLQRYTQLVRSFHRTCPQLIKKKPTPGAARQLKVLEKPDEFIEDPEGFGDFESDFMHLNKTHREHEAEVLAQRENIRHMIVKRKYFNEQKLPGLLLYAEKNEIRNLHARDPEEWTVEKLAESFPATTEVIEKILKSQWRPYSMKRMRKHDEAVLKNWENLKNGKECDNIPPELRAHFLKFSTRALKNIGGVGDEETSFSKLLTKLPEPTGNEFSSIITSCKKYAAADSNHVKKTSLTANPTGVKDPIAFKPNIDPTDETYLIDKVTGKRRMRLEEFERFNSELVNKSPMERNVERFESTLGGTAQSTGNSSAIDFVQKFESTEIVVSAEDTKKYEMTPYKEKIYIPRKLWREGFTYRVQDCYYDDDGEFLYRVPGMSGDKKLF